MILENSDSNDLSELKTKYGFSEKALNFIFSIAMNTVDPCLVNCIAPTGNLDISNNYFINSNDSNLSLEVLALLIKFNIYYIVFVNISTQNRKFIFIKKKGKEIEILIPHKTNTKLEFKKALLTYLKNQGF